MQFAKFLTLAALPSLFVWASCGSSTSTDTSSIDTTTQSTIVVDDTPKALPDTTFSSADLVKCYIEHADTLVDGSLSSFDDNYVGVPGVFTFRKGEKRDASMIGSINGTPSKIELDWTFTTAEDYTPTKYGSWGGGTGWTGQPLFVAWPDSILTQFRASGIIDSDFSGEEIMVGSLAGYVYFIDFISGKPSRKAIDVDNPIKGTMSLDPSLNGNLYVGQGVPMRSGIGALVINLNSHRRSHFVGMDSKALRRWGAYDSSPIKIGQFLFRPGENGTLYKYSVATGSLKLHSALRYTINGAAPGMEASMSAYRNYGFLSDNHGNILCVNLNNMNVVWRYKLPDDSDATPVVCEEVEGVFIYNGCEVEHAGVTQASFVKLDALTGKEIWVNKVPAQRKNINEKHFDGGYYASALPGVGNCSNLIFSNCVANTNGQNGYFIAIERSTGKTRYTTPLSHYAWSSPVGMLNEKGQMYIVTADCAGYVYLINGENGSIITKLLVGSNFESSPVVVGNSIVIGSRGSKIFKLNIL